MNVQGQTNMGTSVNYIHNKPASFKSQFLQSLMTVVGANKRLEKNLSSADFVSVSTEPPKSLHQQSDVTLAELNGRRVWTIKPRCSATQKVLLYLHGGGYVSNLTAYDWSLIKELAQKTNSTIIVPDYPLAPASNCAGVYKYFEGLYSSLIEQYSASDIIFLGNSAGGGIALGFAQKLRNENKRQPSQIILISPWLDITLSNPDIVKETSKDKLLSTNGLRMAAKAYAPNIDGTDFRVSPIYGDFAGLGKISLFIGTHDLFLADARKLKGLLEAQEIAHNYFEYPKMFHVWVAVTSLKESQHAIGQIATLINSVGVQK